MDNQETIEHQKILKKYSQSALALIGGAYPGIQAHKSRIGGAFSMLPEEEWPQWNGNLLDPILQINTSELPIVPLPLQEIKLLCIYVDLENFLDDPTLKQSCQVRTYSDIAALTPRTFPKQEIIKSFEIYWSLNNEENRGFTEGTPVKFSDPNNQYRTKVGGWPGIIQHELEMDIENFVLQIGSEEKAKLNWVDGGILYLGYKDEEWSFECQFF